MPRPEGRGTRTPVPAIDRERLASNMDNFESWTHLELSKTVTNPISQERKFSPVPRNLMNTIQVGTGSEPEGEGERVMRTLKISARSAAILLVAAGIGFGAVHETTESVPDVRSP